jgi:hypothetical protein
VDAGIFFLVLFVCFVVLLVIALLRVKQLSGELSKLQDVVDGLRNAMVVNSQIVRDVATGEQVVTSAPVVDAPIDDLQALLENPLVQQALEQR